MPSWKKLITSGSDASLNSLTVITAVSSSAFSGSYFGNGANLDNIRLFVSGIDLESTPVSTTFSKLQFDSTTGIYVSASDVDTAFVSLGPHFRDIFVDGSATLVATGSDQLDIIAGNGLDISTSLTDTNSNSVSKELIFAVDNTIATTGSNTFVGEQTINGNLIVNGTGSFSVIQSVTGSAKIIGDAYIVLNNNTPSERYAGIKVFDSGSAGVSASLEFDGQTNDWFYEYSDDGGVTTDHGVVIFGPEYSTKGSPIYPTNNTIQKGTGGHHLADTTITDDGTDVTVGINLVVAGDITGSSNATFSGNVGIGTTSPDYTLDVAGNAGFDEYIYHNGDENTYIRFQDDNILLAAGGRRIIQMDEGTDPDKILLGDSTTVTYTSGKVAIGGDGSYDPPARLHVSGTIADNREFQVGDNYLVVTGSNGYVGIGTTSPTASLHVAGPAYFQGGTISFSDTVSDAGIVINENDYIYTKDGNNLRKLIGKGNDVIFIGQAGTSLVDEIRLLPGSGGFTSFYDNSSETMRITGGNVGIGTTTPSTKLEVNGTATVTALVETSTRELKENIETLEDQSTIVDSLQPVTYTWKEDGKEDFGLIAEDVEEIAPHLVHRNEDGKPTGIKYSKLSVLLLDVVQKQNTLINDLNERITKLENERGE